MTTISKTVDIDLSPQDLGRLFAEMPSDQQAQFLNEVGRVAKEWPGGGWCQQAAGISVERGLAEDGRFVVTRLAEHITGGAA